MFRTTKIVIDELWEDVGNLLSQAGSRADDCIWLEKQVETIKDRIDDMECDGRQMWNSRVDNEMFKQNILRRLEDLENEKRLGTTTYRFDTYPTREGDVYSSSNTAPTGSSTGLVDGIKPKETKHRRTGIKS
jgi:hypothetical protein